MNDWNDNEAFLEYFTRFWQLGGLSEAKAREVAERILARRGKEGLLRWLRQMRALLGEEEAALRAAKRRTKK
jgi:hypothetical protein